MTKSTPNFEPERLRVIREARGLTKTELANQLSMSISSLSQYESGKITPSPDSVASLAGALAIPEEFLTSEAPVKIDLDDCHFRRQSGVPKKEQRKAVSWGVLALDLFREADRYVALPDLSLPDYSESRPFDGEEIESIAKDVRYKWDLGFGPLSNIVWLVEQLGVPTIELSDCDDRLDAFSAWTSYRPMVFFTTAKDSPSRRRFDAAHELGHLVLHRDTDPGQKGVEDEAFRFASSFLLPAEPFKSEVPSQLSWPKLREMKKRWKVSLAALVYRAHELGIYSESTRSRAFAQINIRGWRRNEPDEPEMERPSLFKQTVRELKKSGFNSIDEIASELLHVGPWDLRRLVEGGNTTIAETM